MSRDVLRGHRAIEQSLGSRDRIAKFGIPHPTLPLYILWGAFRGSSKSSNTLMILPKGLSR
jgi:hypothetical protein